MHQILNVLAVKLTISMSAKSLKATGVECHTNVMMLGEGSVRATLELADRTRIFYSNMTINEPHFAISLSFTVESALNRPNGVSNQGAVSKGVERAVVDSR